MKLERSYFVVIAKAIVNLVGNCHVKQCCKAHYATVLYIYHCCDRAVATSFKVVWSIYRCAR